MADRDISGSRPGEPAGQLKLEPPPQQLSLTRKKQPQLERKDVASTVENKWNTKNLALRWAADIASASCAAGLVAPLISIIDR
jgi:hypothetical protein